MALGIEETARFSHGSALTWGCQQAQRHEQGQGDTQDQQYGRFLSETPQRCDYQALW